VYKTSDFFLQKISRIWIGKNAGVITSEEEKR
jgi:hypothetical protein